MKFCSPSPAQQVSYQVFYSWWTELDQTCWPSWWWWVENLLLGQGNGTHVEFAPKELEQTQYGINVVKGGATKDGRGSDIWEEQVQL